MVIRFVQIPKNSDPGQLSLSLVPRVHPFLLTNSYKRLGRDCWRMTELTFTHQVYERLLQDCNWSPSDTKKWRIKTKGEILFRSLFHHWDKRWRGSSFLCRSSVSWSPWQPPTAHQVNVVASLLGQTERISGIQSRLSRNVFAMKFCMQSLACNFFVSLPCRDVDSFLNSGGLAVVWGA